MPFIILPPNSYGHTLSEDVFLRLQYDLNKFDDKYGVDNYQAYITGDFNAGTCNVNDFIHNDISLHVSLNNDYNEYCVILPQRISQMTLKL